MPRIQQPGLLTKNKKNQTALADDTLPPAALLEEMTALRRQIGTVEARARLWQKRAQRYQTKHRVLQEQAAQYQRFTEQHPHMMLLTDLHGIIEYVNPQFTLVTGYTPPEVLGHPLHMPPLEHTTTAAREAFWEQCRQGIPWRGEWQSTTKYGHSYLESVSIVPLRDTGGSIAHCLVVKTNITEAIRCQQRLAQDERLASLGTLAAGLAHELNQPLTAIWVAADAILYGIEHGWSLSEERLADSLRLIAEQCQRAATIVEDVRLFARDTSQDQPRPGSLHDSLNRVLRLMGTQLTAHRITLRQQIAPAFPPVSLSPAHLERVLGNLLTNARQALDTIDKPHKVITLTATVEYPMAVLCVEDNGPGIAPTRRPRLFDPFFTTRAPGQGLGLGLSIVHGLLTDAGGDITVTDGQDGGAAFVVRMPIVRSDDAYLVSGR